MARNPNANRSISAGDSSSKRRRRRNKERERPRPESSCQQPTLRRKSSEAIHDLRDISGYEGQRAFREPPFGSEDLAHGVWSKRIGRQAIQSIGWYRNDAALPNHLRSLIDGARLRIIGIDNNSSHARSLQEAHRITQWASPAPSRIC